MKQEFLWSDRETALYADGERFDPWTLSWSSAPVPDDGFALDASASLLKLKQAGGMRRVPVGVIGPKEATASQMTIAEALGGALERHGLQLLCGGKNGVMEAACKGNAQAGGFPVGLLPDEEWHFANPYVAIPVATGIGPARNAIIARASQVLIAVGGGYGTLSEMAFGLHFGRPVLTLADAPFVDGALRCDGVEDAIARTALHVLRGRYAS